MASADTADKPSADQEALSPEEDIPVKESGNQHNLTPEVTDSTQSRDVSDITYGENQAVSPPVSVGLMDGKQRNLSFGMSEEVQDSASHAVSVEQNQHGLSESHKAATGFNHQIRPGKHGFDLDLVHDAMVASLTSDEDVDLSKYLEAFGEYCK